MDNRRNFLKKSMLAMGATSLSSDWLYAKDTASSLAKKIQIQPGDTILFQGDSITDAGRNKENLDPNQANAFGNGYAYLAASQLLNRFAGKNITVYNRGISGNRVPDLIGRWQKDCIDLKPNILSILIGVNDFWRTKDSGASNTPEQYKSQLKQLVESTLTALPDVKLILGEPFAVNGVKHVDDSWYPEFPKYQEAAAEVARELNAIFLPYQAIFDKALKNNTGAYWTTDGVHTSMAGASLMAESWLQLIR